MSLFRVSALLLVFIFSLEARSQEAPLAILERAADEMVQFLDNNKAELKKDPTIADEIVRQKLVPLIDIKGLGRRLLKRKVWTKLTASQQRRFVDAFINHLITQYAKGLAEYDGHRFIFKDTKLSSRGNTAWIASELIDKDGNIFNIAYTLKIIKPESQWKVIDVSVEGIKVLQNYREQLKSVDVDQGFDSLLERLESSSATKSR
ncbi:MAG: ABC transporter substrate-binding protein [Kangiellaceae bacterium]|jgi:phospholipid transport system substrate-binding protein|nr:ABC transporter substrate-binding protein [Kangiellaceae bacterium]